MCKNVENKFVKSTKINKDLAVQNVFLRLRTRDLKTAFQQNIRTDSSRLAVNAIYIWIKVHSTL